MSHTLLKELEREIEKITNGESMPVDQIIENLSLLRKYQKCSKAILKINIKKIMAKNSNGKEIPILEIDKNEKTSFQKEIEKKNIFDDASDMRLEHLGGLEEIKNEIKNFIKVNIKNRAFYKELGFKRARRNILIKGPEGIGKTSLALAIVNEIGYEYIKLNLFDGRISSTLNDNKLSTFLLAVVKNAPCVIILEDLDIFFQSSGGNSKDINRKIEMKLLEFLDYTMDLDVFVIGTINKMENLNKDFLREGRFDKFIEMGLPEENEREKILEKLLENKNCDANLDLKLISQMTSGFVASDLTSLIYKTAEISITEFTKNMDTNQLILKNDYFFEALKSINPIIKKDGFTTIPETSFDDIGALDDLKKDLEHLILNPIRNPDTCAKFKINRNAGILLYGPPGCGKTMLAKAVANSCKANFIYVKGPELLSKYFGESEKAVRGLFERARLSSPCLIFFDEIDGLCPKRSSDGNQVIERVVNQLLTELNGIDTVKQIYVIGATNRPDIIDKAILRPERLGVHLYVPLPSEADRIQILQTVSRKRPLSEDVDISKFHDLFDLTNYSGADLNAFVEAAARNAAWSKNLKNFIDLDDFKYAYTKSKSSINNEDLVYFDKLQINFK